MDFPHFFHRLSASHCDPRSRMMMIKLTTFMNIFLRGQIYITQLLSLSVDKTVVLVPKTTIIVKGGGRGGGGCPTGKIFPKMPLVLGPFAECIYLLCVHCSYLYRICCISLMYSSYLYHMQLLLRGGLWQTREQQEGSIWPTTARIRIFLSGIFLFNPIRPDIFWTF